MQDSKQLNLKKGNLKSQITRFENFVNNLNVAELTEADIMQLRLKIENVRPLLDEFDKIQFEIELLSGAEQPEERMGFENKYYKIMTKAELIFQNLSTHPIISHNADNLAGNRNLHEAVKLPKINMPSFSGNYDEWVEFRDTFVALVDKNAYLTKIQKFHYLKGCLKDRAAGIVSALTVSEANYGEAWSLLTERFENKSLIIQNHVSAIFDMPVVQKESSTRLRQLSDTLQKNVRALRALDLPVDTWDVLLIHIVVSKLDFDSKREWQSHDKSEVPKFKELISFLNKRCEILEALSRPKFEKLRVHTASCNENPVQSNCPICNGGHAIKDCAEFLKLSIIDRTQKIKSAGVCFNCFGRNHLVKRCRVKPCPKCYRRHNILLHLEKHSQGQSTAVGPDEKVASVLAHTSSRSESQQVLLSTATVYCQNRSGGKLKMRALLDNGSQANFITQSAFEKLCLLKDKFLTNIVGIGQINVNSQYSCNIKIFNNLQNFSFDVSCVILQTKITSDLPRINICDLDIPSDVTLADNELIEGGQVDILLGAEVFWNLLGQGRRVLKNGPMLNETRLGWVLGGKCPNSVAVNAVSSIPANEVRTNLCICKELERFWEVENLDDKKEFNLEEKMCETIFENTYKRDADGRFIVELPFKDNLEKLGDSRAMALKRFYNLERRFNNDSKLKAEYVNFMREYRDLGHMCKVEESDLTSSNYFIPHHAVFKTENGKTKIRVVFDASAKSDTGISLNDVQYVGPTIQDELFSILVRFRQYPYVVTADIVKMYRQVLVAEKHRKYQLIFWRESESDPLNVYELNTVTYGEAAAPYLAVRSLVQLANDIERTDPMLAEIIRCDFYMDDLLTGSNSVEGLNEIIQGLMKVLKSGGFELSKWCTNLSEKLIAEGLGQSVTFGERDKILGITWDPREDYLKYSVKNLNAVAFNTKRLILSTVSQLFDPLGILGPVIILAKIIIQRLWKLELDWDDPIPLDIESEWKQIYSELHYLEELKIPRFMVNQDASLIELHGFADASEQAYGACVYIRAGSSGNFTTILVCAKSRVAPTKTICLPRLELCGAVLLSKLSTKVKDSIKIRIDREFYWTDSSVVLHWIKNTSAQWKTFVANRISKIQTATDVKDWYHIKSEYNPADVISRGKTPKEILDCSLWFNGPEWLEEDEARWPQSKIQVKEEILETERKHVIVSNIAVENFEFCSKFSNFNFMLNVFAYVLRFISNCKKENQFKGKISVEERENALNQLIIVIQNEYFWRDIDHLKRRGCVSRKSSLVTLNPFIDDNNILCVGGRLSNSDFDHYKKFPILLPHKHHFTKLLLLDRHKQLLHCGAQTLLASIREKFWPTNGRTLARKIVHDCVTCFRVKPRLETYQMGNLPRARVTPSRPFQVCGTDFAGPFHLRDRPTRGFKLIKTYVCIFVCFSTKAVHLELVMDLSTKAFLAALRRFVSRRGLCSDIYSDNGTNYVGARNEINEIYALLRQNSQSIFEDLNKGGITWHFTPARSPHFGGLWESNIKIFKSHLLKTIGLSSLLYDEFSTILTRIEACLNSRPLCPLSHDPNDLNVLTPAHFLIGGPLMSVPEREPTGQRIELLSRWERTQEITRQFWQRWMRDYINILQPRTKWQRSIANQLNAGDLVLIQQDQTPPLLWPLGRIVELYPGNDGVVRVASVKTTKGVYKRSTRRLCKLPVDPTQC